jgi:hypothetical protein
VEPVGLDRFRVVAVEVLQMVPVEVVLMDA